MPATRARTKLPANENSLQIPKDVNAADVKVFGGIVHLTNLNKLFWPDLALTKRDLLQYYADVSTWLLPHLKDRAMVMKRYPKRHHRRIFLYEAHAIAPPGVPFQLLDPACLRKHHRLPHDSARRVFTLGR